MTINLNGRGDRRVVAYPLLRLMNQLNGGLLITDNALYRSLTIADYIGNVRVSFDMNIKTNDFNIVVRDCCDFEVNADYNICVKSVKGNDAPVPKDSTVIYADFERPTDKNTLFLPFTLPFLRELHGMEMSGRLEPLRNRAALSALSKLFAPIFEIAPKSIRLLLSKGGALS
ncbi:hypothetical protein FACS1894202_14830 [Clostridia bacterium]|nr:hypothetical protein FACS1894202_14830 [Clostridia bacterium]